MKKDTIFSISDTTDKIRTMILNREFQPGEPIRQDALAKQLGISRTPLRQALQSLQNDGLVVHTNNKGARVAVVTTDLVRDLFDMRIVLEPIVFEAALPRQTKLDLAKAEMALDKVEPLSTPAELSDLNWEFHAALYAAAGRDLLMKTVHRLNRTSALATTIGMSITTQPGMSHQEHNAILNACKRGNSDEALALLVIHLTGAKAALLRALDGD